jgi:Activator of Hsp90 ATPase homolog 1-like protein
MSTLSTVDNPVRTSVTVKADVKRAFAVFTEGFNTWWPRTHHIGSGPLAEAVIEPRVGGRCFGREADGTECPWGVVTEWDPPTRFVFAWQINPEWKFEPDLAKASEVEVRFTPVEGGRTRVDLEHRHFSRHGAGADAMRTGVSSPDGWSGLMQLFAQAANREA